MSTDNMNKNVVKFGHGIEISERIYTLIAIVCTPPEGGGRSSNDIYRATHLHIAGRTAESRRQATSDRHLELQSLQQQHHCPRCSNTL